MPSAEILAIGTELLLGVTLDTNTQYLARALRDTGVDLYRTTIIGDNEDRIATAVREAIERCNILITTGGLGPTVDDPTRQAVAKAINTELRFHPELWEQILERFSKFGRTPTENNRRQAYIPAGAIVIPNSVGTAPAFRVDKGTSTIICLPGVPREMEYIYLNEVRPFLKSHYHLQGIIRVHTLHLSGVGESQVDSWIAHLETLTNPTVGLSAHSGRIDIRITAKADDPEAADQMIAQLLPELRDLLGENLYGENETTLEAVIDEYLDVIGKRLTVMECGLGGLICDRLNALSTIPYCVQYNFDVPPIEDFKNRLEKQMKEHKAGIGIGIKLIPGMNTHTLYAIVLPYMDESCMFQYGGPSTLASLWASNYSLDLLRRTLKNNLQSMNKGVVIDHG